MSIFQKVASFLPLSMPQPYVKVHAVLLIKTSEFKTLRELLTIQNPKDLKLNIPNNSTVLRRNQKTFQIYLTNITTIKSVACLMVDQFNFVSILVS